MGFKDEFTMIFGRLRKVATKIIRIPLLAVAVIGKFLLFKMQDGKCMYCGLKVEIDNLHVDLKVPLSRGGTSRISNKQLICSECYRRKGEATDEEFLHRYAFLKSAREAKSPPGTVIPQSQFDERDKELKDAAKRRKPEEGS